MKALWTTIALIGFISISLFGVFLMPFDGSSHDVACIASLITGAKSPCPQDDPLGYANFHNNALKKISDLILIDTMSVVYSVLIIGLILASLFVIKPSEKILVALPLAYIESSNNISYSLQYRKLFWLALHEKRDPALVI